MQQIKLKEKYNEFENKNKVKGNRKRCTYREESTQLKIETKNALKKTIQIDCPRNIFTGSARSSCAYKRPERHLKIFYTIEKNADLQNDFCNWYSLKRGEIKSKPVNNLQKQNT